MIITIDGKSGLGKSSVAQKLADQRRMCHISSGRIYRYITSILLQSNEIIDETQASRVASEIDIVAVNNMEDSTLRSSDVTINVNKVAKIGSVRQSINRALIDQARGQDFVLDGRDMSFVFPDADFKFVFHASREARLWLATAVKGKPYEASAKIMDMRDRCEPSFQYPDDVIYLNPIKALQSGTSILQTINQIIDCPVLHSPQRGVNPSR